ncbi:hypothetical protein XENOCAPTIV_014824 [Xenoophorus captivus]|uniref:Uncharacterized protein n=1 Tax=Xenoophorus captivus TaxID=1517983 RepID=A0ABV0QJ99_9TELE
MPLMAFSVQSSLIGSTELNAQWRLLHCHQALTALLVTSGSGDRPLCLYRWSEGLWAFYDPAEPDLILMLHTPLQGLVWWPGIDGDVETMVKDCEACLTRGKTGPPTPPPLQPLPCLSTP